jgi:hypothetical protein
MFMRACCSLALAAACCAPVQAAGVFERDWVKHPAVIDRPAAQTIFAIGDIHGDYERLVGLLVAARIIPAAPGKSGVQWGAGAAKLVVTGDMIDKGPHPVVVLRLLAGLQTAAREQGGEVILLAGNHEAEFLAQPGEKKAADFIADLSHFGLTASKVGACEQTVGEFLCTLPFAARVGDWFFSHAGNTGGRTLAQLDADLHEDVSKHGFAAKELAAPDSLLEARLGETTWFAGKTAEAEREKLSAYAGALGVKHMAQGHQHNDVKFADGVERRTGEMFQRWGLLFLLDVGMSEGVGDSHGAVLRIANGEAAAICADGGVTTIWSEREKTDTGRAAPCAH